MDWKPIERVKDEGDVRPHERDALLVRVFVQLNREPPPEWVELFDYPRGRVVLGDSDGRLRLERAAVSAAAEEGQIEDVVKVIDDRIDHANRCFERDVLPRTRAREEKARRAEQAKAERLAEATAKLRSL